jgi:lactate dehydrogenase-like 2-hydroxyacid dehydrogenase
MFKVLFTGNTFTDVELQQLLSEGYEIIPAGNNLSEEELILQLKDKDAYIVGGQEVVSEVVLQSAMPQLKLVTNFGIGAGTIDLVAAKKLQITVTNTFKVSTYSVAELTVALLMTLNKRIMEFTQDIKNDQWKRLEMYDLKNKTVGIIGMGAIGTYTARILKNAFNMRVIYSDILQKFTVEEELNAKKVSLDTLLSEADFVSVHAPLNENTKNMIGEKELQLMKPQALLINTARAWVVNPDALFTALSSGTIAGAAFDGFYTEPVDRTQPGGNLLNLGETKFILTPHTGFNAYENAEKLKSMTIDNLKTVLNGIASPNVVK